MKEFLLYRSIRESLDEKSKFDEIIKLNHGISINSNRLEYIYGKGIDEYPDLSDNEGFNLIISRAVLEHVFNLDKAFLIMDANLKEGGYMLHKIDFRDHGLFSSKNFPLLTFLTIPNSIYSLMSKNIGGPNRKYIRYYENILTRLNYDFKIYITNILGRDKEFNPFKEDIVFNVDYFEEDLKMISNIRNEFDNSFTNMQDKELMISTIFIIAKKLKRD